tara:strand:- start:157077 stop:158969 length:1893 start_codon:yes stop_codon:yes gene_type:complete
MQGVAVGTVMDESFGLALPEWTLEKLVAFLAGTHYSHLIILRPEGETHYRYLYSMREVWEIVHQWPPETTVQQAFDLHESTATPELTIDTAVADIFLPRVTVMDRGRVVGFIDESEIPAATGMFPPVRASLQLAASGAAPPFEAYPSLTAPDTALPGDPFDIYVGFREQADPTLSGGGLIRIENPDPNEDCLVILSGDGVTLDRDYDYVPLKCNASVRFSGALKPGASEASVKALFSYKGQVISAARRQILATGAAAEPEVNTVVKNPCRIEMPSPETAVDITISLDSKRDGTLEWRVIAPDYPQELEKIKLETYLPDTKQFAADLMRDLKARSFRGPFARNILETMGQDIASYLPAEIMDVLQVVHGKLGRAPTLLLLTNETYVPWELAYLAKPLDPGAPPFLGAQVIMGRWIEESEVMLPPTVSLDVERMTAVASEYGLAAGQTQLLEAIGEQQALCQRWQAIPLQATSSEMEVMVTGEKIPGHLVHFAVHGYSDPSVNNQALLLADNTQLPASAMTGAHTCGATPRFSFVFLNACQVGTPGRSLGHAGGFPGVLVRGGTVGFIAPLWDVHDDIARDAAETFYEETFTNGCTVGEALHARRKAYNDDSTTPLAYIYYGHPGLRLNRLN